MSYPHSPRFPRLELCPSLSQSVILGRSSDRPTFSVDVPGGCSADSFSFPTNVLALCIMALALGVSPLAYVSLSLHNSALLKSRCPTRPSRVLSRTHIGSLHQRIFLYIYRLILHRKTFGSSLFTRTGLHRYRVLFTRGVLVEAPKVHSALLPLEGADFPISHLSLDISQLITPCLPTAQHWLTGDTHHRRRKALFCYTKSPCCFAPPAATRCSPKNLGGRNMYRPG